MATPDTLLQFSKQRALSPNGRCSLFAAAVNSSGWGGGVAVPLRLSSARHHGHPAFAVVPGTATNQDGAISGLTARNGPPHQRLIRPTQANALLMPSDMDVMEGRGTDDGRSDRGGVVCAVAGAPTLDAVEVVPPVFWAVMMVSLTAMWQSCGVESVAVAGHFQGEIAACVAFAPSPEHGARVVALCSRLIAADLAGKGGMMSVALPADEARERLVLWAHRLCLAAVNDARSTVVCGKVAALDELCSRLSDDGAQVRKNLYASHSQYVETIREPFAEVLAPVGPRLAAVSFYSTVTGGPFDTTGLDAEYWLHSLRQTVHFEQATRTLLADGFGLFGGRR